MLFACRESYCVASKVYSPCFSSLGALHQTFFNYELDTLYLDADSFPEDRLYLHFYQGLERLLEDECAKFQNLAFHINLFHWYGPGVNLYNRVSDLWALLAFFGNVKEVLILNDDHSIASVLQKKMGKELIVVEAENPQPLINLRELERLCAEHKTDRLRRGRAEFPIPKITEGYISNVL